MAPPIHQSESAKRVRTTLLCEGQTLPNSGGQCHKETKKKVHIFLPIDVPPSQGIYTFPWSTGSITKTGGKILLLGFGRQHLDTREANSALKM